MGNELRVVVSRNSLTGGSPGVAAQAAASSPGGEVVDNVVSLRALGNQVEGSPEQAFMVSDGHAGNRIEVEAGSQAYSQADGDLLA